MAAAAPVLAHAGELHAGLNAGFIVYVLQVTIPIAFILWSGSIIWRRRRGSVGPAGEEGDREPGEP